MDAQLRINSDEGESDDLSDTDSETEQKCIDCSRTKRKRCEEEQLLSTIIEQKERFRSHVLWKKRSEEEQLLEHLERPHDLWKHDQTWLNYNGNFLYCSFCYSILAPVREDHGAIVHSLDKELCKELDVENYHLVNNRCFGGGNQYLVTGHFDECKCKENTVHGYYVLSDINRSLFENVSIWVDINQNHFVYDWFSENYITIYDTTTQTRYNRYSRYFSVKNFYGRSSGSPSLFNDTHFIHCDHCLNGPVGYIETMKGRRNATNRSVSLFWIER